MKALRKSTIALLATHLVDPLLAQTTTIQIGFLNPLIYPFVSSNPDAAAQIAENLPPAIAYGLNISRSPQSCSADSHTELTYHMKQMQALLFSRS